MPKPYKIARDELDELEAKLAKLKSEQQDISDRMEKLEGRRSGLLGRCNKLSEKILNRKLRLHAVEPAYCHNAEDFTEVKLIEIPNLPKSDNIISRYMKCTHKGCSWWGTIGWYEQERAE